MPKTLLHRTHPPTLLLTRLLNSTKQVQRYFLTKRAFVSRSLTRRRERVGVRVFVTKIGLDTSPHLRPSLRPACGKGEKDTTCQTTFSAMLSSVRQESQSDKDKNGALKTFKGNNGTVQKILLHTVPIHHIRMEANASVSSKSLPASTLTARPGSGISDTGRPDASTSTTSSRTSSERQELVGTF